MSLGEVWASARLRTSEEDARKPGNKGMQVHAAAGERGRRTPVRDGRRVGGGDSSG
jgi:hypothetical protein